MCNVVQINAGIGSSAVLEPLALHGMSIEAVARLDLAKDDIILVHVVGGGHGFVGALVVGPDPRI